MRIHIVLLLFATMFSGQSFAITARLVSTKQIGYWPPAINNGRVVFRASDGTLNLIDGGSAIVIARDGDPAPSGGTFRNVNNNTGLDIDAQGNVAFYGETTLGDGIYLYQNGMVSTVATGGTPIPGMTGNFGGFNRAGVGIDNGIVVISGYYYMNDSVAGGGVYKFSGGQLSKVVDSHDIRAESLGTYDRFFEGVDIDGSMIVFMNGNANIGGAIYRRDHATGLTIPVMEVGQPIPVPSSSCGFGEIDTHPAISNGEIAAYGSTVSCNIVGTINSMTVGSVTNASVAALRVSALGYASAAFIGQSIDGTNIVSLMTESGSSQLVLDENGTARVLITEAGFTDDNGNTVSSDGVRAFSFGDRGLSQRKIVFGGVMNSVPGIVVLDIDGVGSQVSTQQVPFVPLPGLIILAIALTGIAVRRSAR